MPPAKKVLGRQNAALSADTIQDAIAEYVGDKSLLDAVTARVNTMKANITAYIRSKGYRDDKGHQWFDVDGIAGVSKVKLERRVSTYVDAEKAQAWLEKHGLWNECSDLVPAHREFSEEKLLALGFDRKIPAKVIESFTVTSESTAFKTVK